MNRAESLTSASLLRDGKHVLFGFALPVLPDFLADHTLLSDHYEQRIEEFCRRWTQSVATLWSESNDAVYSLRYDFDPGHETTKEPTRTSCSFLCRVFDDSYEVVARRQEHVRTLLTMLNFRPEPLDPQALQGLLGTSFAHAFEIGAQENYQSTRFHDNSDVEVPPEFLVDKSPVAGARGSSWMDATLYSLRSFWGAAGTMLLPFHALASQRSKTTVTILLRPTVLNAWEEQNLVLLARSLESIAQLQTKAELGGGGVTRKTSQSATDPQLRHLARTIAGHIRRLNHPFLISVGCASDDEAGARQVASTLAALVREERPYDNPEGEASPIDASCAIQAALAPREFAHTHFGVFLDDDQPYKAAPFRFDPKLRRIRHLVDGKGATTFFRFPISVRGGVPGIEVRQPPPDFHPGARVYDVGPDEINIGRYHAGGLANIKVAALSKHALITGFTGSGKTNTVLHLLYQLWSAPRRIPFLAIESAKQEYRELCTIPSFQRPDGSSEIAVYTVGNSTLRPMYLNPFELIEGVRLEAHIGRLQTAFEAALPPVGPLPSLIAEALVLVYTNLGWDLSDVGPDESAGLDPDRPPFPTMTDLEAVLRGLIGPKSAEYPTARNYQGDILHNMMGFVMGRLRPLLIGSKGKMFSRRRSYPRPRELFENPTIIELNDLNANDKALMVMFLVTLLREYREANPGLGGLRHLTVVEEAHNVLSNPKASGGDEPNAQAKAVEAFCNMLTEIRSLGEGLLIADQSPEKLAPDAMRNTNLQIAHQLRDSADREAIARAMIMTEEQRDFLGKVRPGMAGVFYTGLERATFVEVPEFIPTRKEADLFRERFSAAVRAGRAAGGGSNSLREALETTLRDPECLRIQQSYPGFGCGWWWLMGASTGEAYLRKAAKGLEVGAPRGCWNCDGACGLREAFGRKPDAETAAQFTAARKELHNWRALHLKAIEAGGKGGRPDGALQAEGNQAMQRATEQFVTVASVLAAQAGLAGDFDAAWCANSHLYEQLNPDAVLLRATRARFLESWRTATPAGEELFALREEFRVAFGEDDVDRLVELARRAAQLARTPGDEPRLITRLRYRAALSMPDRPFDEEKLRAAIRQS